MREAMLTGNIPPITIGLPVYNGERYLEEALKAILSQTFEDFSLMICDNASTDRTYEICQTYEAQDTRIQCFRNEQNIGGARNFNRVFSLSKSEYFKWAACDDLIAPEFLKICIEILEREPEVILAYTKNRLIDAEGKIIGTYEDGLNLVSASPHGRFLQVFHNIWMANPAFGLIRSDAIKKTRLFMNYPNSDLVWLAELSLYGQFREAPYYLFYRRLHPSSIGGASLSGKKIIPAKTVNDRYEYYNPGSNNKRIKNKQKMMKKYLIMIMQSNITLDSKICLFVYLLSSAFIFIIKNKLSFFPFTYRK
jgi:glycosyltransferase involved in cell wall biosynthesis